VKVLAHYPYYVVIFLMMAGLYTVMSRGNLIKELVGLTIFQTSVSILFILLGAVEGSIAPILRPGGAVYANPLPHVLILTAIVVGVATLAVGLALVVRIHQAFGTVEEAALFEGEDDG
jgi:multicomponent Na+:H+ antiporter subunit C